MLLSKLVQSLTRLGSKFTSTCRIKMFMPEKSTRIKRVKLQFIKLSHGLIQRGCSGSGTPSPEKSQKYRVSLQYWSGSPKQKKATKPAFNVGPSSACQQSQFNGVSLAGRCWPIYSGIWILYPLINQKRKRKKISNLDPCQ